MKPFPRPLRTVGCGAFLAVAFVVGLSWWLTGGGSPFSMTGVLHEEARRRQVLEANLAAINRCADRKVEVARQVAEGDLTLNDAAHRFRELHEARDAILGDRANPDVPTSDEALCRNVITWVGGLLKHDPDRARTTTARLEAELGRIGEQPMRG